MDVLEAAEYGQGSYCKETYMIKNKFKVISGI